MITKNELRASRNMSAEDLRNHESWTTRNMILGSILAGGLVLMAIWGSTVAPEPYVKTTNAFGISDVSATSRDTTGGVSAFALMSSASGRLPVRPEDEPAF